MYVRHLADPDGGEEVVRLADPVPAGDRKMSGAWWPPAMLEGGSWIDRHHHEFDVFHVHFGFDAVSVDQLAAALAALERHGKSLVLTVHDLRNPHQRDSRPHTERLQLLIDQAEAIITLTPGAAARIDARWSRAATVLSHPHVVPRVLVGAPRRVRRHPVIGVHAKSLRACLDPVPVARALITAVEAIAGGRLRIDVHHDVLDPGSNAHDPHIADALVELGRHPAVDLFPHDYFDDDQLWEYMRGLDVSVLPYRFGSHSGWMEACYDLGTAVVAPTCGFYAEQRPCHTYELSDDRFDRDSLIEAVHRSLSRTAPQAMWDERRVERHRLADAHKRIYRDVMA
ncbi:MAG: glycosyltransferase family 1 protein [Actinomycetota bacterium]|nr:glycosyltransferase family 1 protein [Actinomycetota bacterium]